VFVPLFKRIVLTQLACFAVPSCIVLLLAAALLQVRAGRLQWHCCSLSSALTSMHDASVM
jgi:hypothetical protein